MKKVISSLIYILIWIWMVCLEIVEAIWNVFNGALDGEFKESLIREVDFFKGYFPKATKILTDQIGKTMAKGNDSK